MTVGPPCPAPVLTIAVAHYNHNDKLPRLLESIAAQRMDALDVLVVDDGSAVSCRDIVEAYGGKGLHVRLIEHGVNRGLKNTRLTGIGNAHCREPVARGGRWACEPISEKPMFRLLKLFAIFKMIRRFMGRR